MAIRNFHAKKGLVTFQPKNLNWHLNTKYLSGSCQVDQFPFLQHIPFDGNCHLLGASEGLYVFQSFAKLEELTVAKDLNKPEDWQVIRVDSQIPHHFQKDSSFVVSEEKMVLLSHATNGSYNIDDHSAISVCLKTGQVLFILEIENPGYFRGETNGYLFFDNYMIHLKSDNLTKILYTTPVNFHCHNTVSCGNSYYVLQKGKSIESWESNHNGQLQFKWATKESFKIGGVPVILRDIVCNNKYIVVKGEADCQAFPVENLNSLHILDSKGKLQAEICLSEPNTKMILVDDILVYIHDPKELAFWHIPSKKSLPTKFGFAGKFRIAIIW